jgi:prepilin-type N-terminal cleavage/methylation domain-containing protein
MSWQRYSPARRGFTFVELMIGIVVTALVLVALSTFLFAVGQNWEDSDTAQSAFLAACSGADRLNQLVRSAQEIGPNPTSGSLDNSTPPAACVLWTDTNGNGVIEYDELTLLEYDPSSQSLVAFSIPTTATNAATQPGSLPSVASFQALPNMTQSASSLTGSAYVSLTNILKTPVIHSVTACQIFAIPPNAATHPSNASLEVILQMANGSSQTFEAANVVYLTSTVRAPLATP